MIGFFPDPYPDELLYSVCARLSLRSKYPRITATVRELFGSENATAIIDLPGRLTFLVSQLPPGHLYTAERLIEEHTLLPFYAPFLPPERLQNCKEDLCSARGNRIRERLGITASRLKLRECFRYCPTCVEEDRKKYGETYWHRIHQVTGVEICPHHAISLETSSAYWKDSKSPGKFISAEKALLDVSPSLLRLPEAQHPILLKIATDAAWLLRQRNLSIGPEILNRRYYNLLLRNGYAYYNGRIRTRELLRDFIGFYSPELLDKLRCSINDTSHSWVTRLALKDKATVVQHPLCHLLLLTFLGYIAKEVLTQFTEYKAFGAGPWPCLNRASGHFNQPRVSECRVVDSLVKGKSRRPMGIFTCDCGFIYTRMGPDTSEEVRGHTDSVRAYGHIWEDTLSQLWLDQTISIREMAHTLGVYEATVVRRAIQLGLPYPRNLSTIKQSVKISKRYLIRRRAMLDTLGDRRREWLSVIKAHPNASRSELRRISYYLYFWLRRNDLDWLESHIPPSRKSVRKTSLLDWDSADRQLSVLVKAAATRINNLPGRPTRTSITAIIKEVGSRSLLEKQLDKLPLTAKVIEEHVESLGPFEIRKVLWAEELYIRDRVSPTKAQFIKRAGVKNITGGTLAVQSAIDGALKRLRKKFC